MAARRARSVGKATAGDLLEDAFLLQVVGLARVYGWRRIYHAATVRFDRVNRGLGVAESVGFPDLILIRGPELVVAELKTRTGRLGAGQSEWLEAWEELARQVNWCVDLAAQAPRVGVPFLDPPPHRPRITVRVWRADNAEHWEEIQATLGSGLERRRDLDPLAP